MHIFEQLIIVCNNIGYRCLQLSKVIPAAFICEGCNTEKKAVRWNPPPFYLCATRLILYRCSLTE